MANFLTTPCSTLPAPSAVRPSNLLSSSQTRAPRGLQALSASKISSGRKYTNSSTVVLAIQCEENNRSREAQSSVRSENGSMTKLGSIACGVFASAAVAWDLMPAFADQLSPVPVPVPSVTPYSKASDRMKVGLMKGRIQACPLDINPNCVSTASNNGGYAAPWIIPESNSSNAAKKIESAILSTQKNPAILNFEETPDGGTYLVAEADGFLGRDVMEFLIREDVVTYRSMAKKVVYFYPFTTPIGDFDGQQRRLKTLEDELGWSVPSFENTFYDQDFE